MNRHVDAIICGAGPAGSTAAILLARAGWSVVIVERSAFPRRKVCGECLAPSNYSLLEALGVQTDFLAAAGPDLRRAALMLGGQTIEADLPPLRDSKHPWGRALGRETLDELLLDAAREAGAVVLQPWTVSRMQRCESGYKCTLRPTGSHDEVEYTASIAIAAHGSAEGRRGRRRASDLLAFKAHFKGAVVPAGLLPVLSFTGGYGGMVLADQGRTTLACCIRTDRLAQLRSAQPQTPAGEVVDGMLRRECAGVSAALEAATRDGAWLACGPLDPGIHLRSDDEVLRIGNAAGEAHPIVGEGMSMAMQSAWLLCEQLLQRTPPLRLRDHVWQRGIAVRYDAVWRRNFSRRLAIAAVFAHAAMRPRLLAPLVPALEVTRLLARGAEWCGKIRALEVGHDNHV